MIEDHLSLEDLLLATLDAVSRFRVGQREAVSAALDAGALLTKAKGRLHHGEWGDWLHRVGLAPRTASTWMKLAGMDLTAEDGAESTRRPGASSRNRLRKPICPAAWTVTWPKPKPRSQTLNGPTTMHSTDVTGHSERLPVES